MEISHYSGAVGDLVQPFNANQACHSARFEDIPNLSRCCCKAKILGISLDKSMDYVNLLQGFS
jgi:hypothetical protein